MAFPNNAFPATYQNPYYQQLLNQQAQQHQPQTAGIIWVQGEAGTKSYMLVPNTTVALWDSEQQVIYWKTSDASGMPSMKILDYTVREPETSQGGAAAGISKDDFDRMKEEIESLKKELETLKPRKEE